jgi:hypothetical protein
VTTHPGSHERLLSGALSEDCRLDRENEINTIVRLQILGAHTLLCEKAD